MIKLNIAGDQEPAEAPEKLALPAPLWHFALFVAISLSIPSMAYIRPGGRGLLAFLHLSPSGAMIFAITIVINILLTIYAIWGLHLNGNEDRIFHFEGGPHRPFEQDVVIGIALFIGCMIVSIVLSLSFPSSNDRTWMRPLMRTDLDHTLLLFLTFVAPICEEIQFRGYILRQLAAITRNTSLAIVVQALLFVIMHGPDQGVSGYLTRFVYGVAFGLITVRRNSLWPAIVAHFLIDMLVFMVTAY